MFFLDREYLFQHALRSRIVIGKVDDHLAIAFDRDAFRNQIFLDHCVECIAFNVLGVAARAQSIGREVRFATQFDNALCEAIGMAHFLFCVSHKFCLD